METKVQPGLWQKPCSSGLAVCAAPRASVEVGMAGGGGGGDGGADAVTATHIRASKSEVQYVCTHTHAWEGAHWPHQRPLESKPGCMHAALTYPCAFTHPFSGTKFPHLRPESKSFPHHPLNPTWVLLPRADCWEQYLICRTRSAHVILL